jgi:hypothetical protein
LDEKEIAMPRARVTFHKLIQDSQDYGSDDEHMVSRVFFTLEVEGTSYKELYVDIKQPVGSDFEEAPLEVSHPHSYSGPFNHQAFQKAVEAYYRGLVGASSSGIRIQGGGNIRMRNNTFIRETKVEFDVSKESPAW